MAKSESQKHLQFGPTAKGYAEKAVFAFRFDDDAGRTWPFRFRAAADKAQETWWDEPVSRLLGQGADPEKVNAFAARQLADIACSSSFMAMTPDVQGQTMRETGQNKVRGGRYGGFGSEPDCAPCMSATETVGLSEQRDGSWWTAWLGARSLSKVKVPLTKPPKLCAAPAT
jgi:hypothetical protein